MILLLFLRKWCDLGILLGLIISYILWTLTVRTTGQQKYETIGISVLPVADIESMLESAV